MLFINYIYAFEAQM